MARVSVFVVSLGLLGTLGGLAYMHSNRETSSSVEEPMPEAPKPVKSPAVATQTSQPAPAPPASIGQITTGAVERWIADTQSNDARTRAAAIESLATAPKAQAILALERVLESGEPQVDRQIALRSLHALALNDGDDTGAIRDAIRHAMYHSDDESVTHSAQAFLEDIEAALAE